MEGVSFYKLPLIYDLIVMKPKTKSQKKKKNENEDFDKIYNKRSTDLDVLLEDSSFYITIEILYTFSITSNFRQVQLMTL